MRVISGVQTGVHKPVCLVPSTRGRRRLATTPSMPLPDRSSGEARMASCTVDGRTWGRQLNPNPKVLARPIRRVVQHEGCST